MHSLYHLHTQIFSSVFYLILFTCHVAYRYYLTKPFFFFFSIAIVSPRNFFCYLVLLSENGNSIFWFKWHQHPFVTHSIESYQKNRFVLLSGIWTNHYILLSTVFVVISLILSFFIYFTMLMFSVVFNVWNWNYNNNNRVCKIFLNWTDRMKEIANYNRCEMLFIYRCN